MAIFSGVLTWEIPCTQEPGGLSPWDHKESDTTEVTDTFIMLQKVEV